MRRSGPGAVHASGAAPARRIRPDRPALSHGADAAMIRLA